MEKTRKVGVYVYIHAEFEDDVKKLKKQQKRNFSRYIWEKVFEK